MNNGRRTGLEQQKRLVAVMIGAIVLFCAAFGSFFYDMIVKGPERRVMAENQWVRSTTVDASRGTIYDRNGVTLAVSAGAHTVIARPNQIEDKASVALQLAPILQMDYEDVLKAISRDKAEVYVKRMVPDEVADEIRALKIKGISFTEESERYYPLEHLASQIVGFMGTDQGLSGIEYYYESYLSGDAGKIIAETDTRGNSLPFGIERYYAADEGLDLTLTVDTTIQSIVDNGLKKAIEENGCTVARAVAMDPRTGAVLAMSTLPNYDPNNYSQYDSKNWANGIVSTNYEPGSTFKTFIMAAALEENLLSEDTTFYDSGSILVSNAKINCWKKGGHGLIDLYGALENSCNPAFVQIGSTLGTKLMYSYLEAFGFGQKTGIDLPGEESGIMTPIEKVGPVEQATISFGQGISATMLQVASAFSAVINGGYLLEPYVVDHMTDANGETVYQAQRTVVRQVISEETSELMRDMLLSVVENGTGSRAAVEGYSIGGKTGTSQKYVEGKYDSSFIGFATVEDTRVVLLVVLDEPRENAYTGGVIVAPVFSSMMSEILAYLELEQADPVEVEKNELVAVPDVRGQKRAEGKALLESYGFKVELYGTGTQIVGQSPAAGLELAAGSTVVLYVGEGNSAGKVAVPDLTGCTVKNAGEWLEALGLKMSVEGSGYCVDQAPQPGTQADRGASIRVIFSQEGSAKS